MFAIDEGSKNSSLRRTAQLALFFVVGIIWFTVGMWKSGNTGQTIQALSVGLGIEFGLAKWLTTVLVVEEIVLGASMIPSIAPRVTASISLLQSCFFVCWHVMWEYRGLRVSCGCGFEAFESAFGDPAQLAMFASVALACLSVIGFLLSRRS